MEHKIVSYKEAKKLDPNKYVRYKEGAELFSMSQSSFEKLAKDANATYKINKIVLVNTELVEKYLESCRIEE